MLYNLKLEKSKPIQITNTFTVLSCQCAETYFEKMDVFG